MSFSKRLKTIVVATDLQGHSEAALEYARKIAAAYGARIVLAHGVDPLDYAAINGVPAPVMKDLAEEARAALDILAHDLLREGIHSHSEIRQGTVAEMLVAVALQYEAGLIVIGTEGMQGAGPVLVGSIAEALVRLAPCPVMAVAADWNAGTFRPAPGGPVLLAMERNEASAAAVATAWSLAETFRRALIVLHARTPEEVRTQTSPCAATLEEFGVKATAQSPVRCVVMDGTPAEVVDAAITQYHPCILVAGVKRASDTKGPHGTAFALLARSRVPVMCVPPEKAEVNLEQEACIPAETR
jgi:nucleotide-binding universal stress UspA family protein